MWDVPVVWRVTVGCGCAGVLGQWGPAGGDAGGAGHAGHGLALALRFHCRPRLHRLCRLSGESLCSLSAVW